MLSNNLFVYSQEVNNQKYNPDKPNYFIPKNHDPNFLKLNKLPSKSFYESKADWQRIIDSTWGAGDSLSQKLLIYNTFAQKVRNEFDGFISLQLNWDSLYNFYLNKITGSTSKGAFSSIISHFAYDLKDQHSYAWDNTVVLTPLNPGVPILLLGSFNSVEHFGAVTTILPDSTTLVLRVVPNHPLNLEPGDIILGYEGIPWKTLVQELLNAGLPTVANTGGCKTADTYHNLFGVGLNWHLFNTIDIIKHSSNDTVHLSVLPLLNLNVPTMFNNEQISIPNIPFPNILVDQNVTYGILENTNIGYIYLAKEWPEATADAQFYAAVNSLKNTDALIIDMRMNFGGWAFFENAFEILFNEPTLTIEDSYRCNITTFNLCPLGNATVFQINAKLPNIFDRPIAVLLGPTCMSMGDVTAQRLRYHPMVRFFGTSSDGTLGDNLSIANFPGWLFRYSISDMFHSNNPGVYLNRREFPIDFPVWHNRDDVAIGKDAVVENALDWINNLVYPHNTMTDKGYYSPIVDTVHLSTIIENPNAHQLSARVYLKTLENVLIDSVDLTHQLLNPDSEQWVADFSLPMVEEFYKMSITSFDATASEHFTVPNATRFTTAGPLVLDSIFYVHLPAQKRFSTKPYLTNLGNLLPITGVTVKIKCEDPWIRNFPGTTVSFPTIQPGATVISNSVVSLLYDSTTFPGYFNLRFEIMSDGFCYWKDSLKFEPVIVGVEEELNPLPTEFSLSQNYPNPFNSTSVIKYSIPKLSQVSLKIFNTLGEEIETLLNEDKPVGTYELNWNAANLPSGVYFYRLQAGSFLQTKKMILLK